MCDCESGAMKIGFWLNWTRLAAFFDARRSQRLNCYCVVLVVLAVKDIFRVNWFDY